MLYLIEMKATRRRVIAGGATAVVAGLAGCVGGENDVEETVTDERQAEDIEQLSVENTNGRVDVRGSDRETISITGRKRAPDEDRLGEVAIETTETDQTLTVAVSDDGGGILMNLGPTPAVDLVIEVPASLADVDAETTNGGVTVRGVDSAIAAETTNGDVTAALNEPENVVAETTNGDIELTVPSTIEAELSLDTTNGSLDVHELESYETTSESSIEATVGAGTHRIECETTNGDVTVRGRS